jgi:DNA-binding transcriptional LysR family regulator
MSRNPAAPSQNLSPATIRELDLGLLVVLDSMLRTRSVTQTARELSISQPTASAALNRLRKVLNDPLFVRSAKGMNPTPRAESLARPVANIIECIRSELLLPASFSPESERRHFTINMQDIGECVFLPKLVKYLSDFAPGITIRTVSLPAGELELAMRSGEVDLAVGHFPSLHSAAIYQQRLFTHSYVCVVSDRHHCEGDAMTRKQFLESAHAVIQEGGFADGYLDKELAAQGLRRRIVLEVQHYLAIPSLLQEMDLTVVVPYAIGKNLAKFGNIRLLRPPFRAQQRVVRQHWHSRSHFDPANRWLRGVIAELFMNKHSVHPICTRPTGTNAAYYKSMFAEARAEPAA